MKNSFALIRSPLIGISLASVSLALAVCFVLMQRDAAAVDGASSGDKGVLRHVVLFKFKESSSEADVQAIVDGFGMLPKKISAIHDYEFGTNISPEGLSEDFTHCFLVTFKSEKDRDAYLPHPDHKAFVKILKPHLDKVLVVDYWAK